MKAVSVDHRLRNRKALVDILFEDGSLETVELVSGPGAWFRVVQELQNRGLAVGPEDFDETIQALYYDFKREKVRNRPDLMERFRYFVCPVCDCIYHTWEHEHTDPCDNCEHTHE